MAEKNGQDAPQSKIQELKKKYGDIYSLSFDHDGDHHDLICRLPKTGDVSRFGKSAGRDQMKAARNMLVGCMIDPPFMKLKDIFDRWPGLVIAIATELMELIGADVEVVSKKL